MNRNNGFVWGNNLMWLELLSQFQPVFILWRFNDMKVRAYIHSLKDKEHDRHVLGDADIIEKIGDNLYIAEYNGVRCTAIFNPFVCKYFVDDVYGVQGTTNHVYEFNAATTETLKMTIRA